MKHDFKPTPSPIAMGMWEQLGRLHLPLGPTAGICWRTYKRAGGPVSTKVQHRG